MQRSVSSQSDRSLAVAAASQHATSRGGRALAAAWVLGLACAVCALSHAPARAHYDNREPSVRTQVEVTTLQLTAAASVDTAQAAKANPGAKSAAAQARAARMEQKKADRAARREERLAKKSAKKASSDNGEVASAKRYKGAKDAKKQASEDLNGSSNDPLEGL